MSDSNKLIQNHGGGKIQEEVFGKCEIRCLRIKDKNEIPQVENVHVLPIANEYSQTDIMTLNEYQRLF